MIPTLKFITDQRENQVNKVKKKKRRGGHCNKYMSRSSEKVSLIQSGMYIHGGGNPGRLHSRGGNGAGPEEERQLASQRSRLEEAEAGGMGERTISLKIQGEREDGTSEELYKVLRTELTFTQCLVLVLRWLGTALSDWARWESI